MKKILILSDNIELLIRFKKVIKETISKKGKYIFKYSYSFNNNELLQKYKNAKWISPLNIKQNITNLANSFNLIISIHCKQLFPAELVKSVRCINVHPGLNPYNRGWYPQVFSIINGLPCGATIHEMDEFLDHGPVICQKEVNIELWDTSLSAYNKILDAEINLLKENLLKIIENNYSKEVKKEGNLNLKKDFSNLCKIDFNNIDSFKNHINILRALTHGKYNNAYFEDNNGNKVIIKIGFDLLKKNKN